MRRPLPPLEDSWLWEGCPDEVKTSECGRVALFHAKWSHGAAAARGSRRLNHGRFYWELHLPRVYGTAIQAGVGTQAARLRADHFTNLIGEDSESWGLSHKGLLWHGGQSSPYSQPFPENQAITIGVLFDGIAGTLGFFWNQRWLGIAFTGLNKVDKPLYPMIASTAARIEISLMSSWRDVGSLAERCRAQVVRTVSSPSDILKLPLPSRILEYLSQATEPVVLDHDNPAYHLHV